MSTNNGPRPICHKHLIEMYVVKNDIMVGDREIAGFQSSFWQGDLYRCPHPDCDASVVTGFGRRFTNQGDKKALIFDYSYRPTND